MSESFKGLLTPTLPLLSQTNFHTPSVAMLCNAVGWLCVCACVSPMFVSSMSLLLTLPPGVDSVSLQKHFSQQLWDRYPLLDQ